MTSFHMDTLKKWYREHFDVLFRDYCTFLRFQSMSTDPAFAQETKRAADWVCSYLNQMGMQASLWETSGYPVVFGEYKAGNDCPTIFLYSHYDVQPVDPIELWKHDPFSPHLENGVVYARGAADNKGQCMYVMAALRAFLSLGKEKKINIKYFIEGEEESGSHGTLEALKTHRDALRADALFVVDAGMLTPNTPAVTIGVRGIMTMEIALQNSNADLHSGIHGGIVLNPNRAFVTLFAQLWDETGRVQVPGFYDAVQKISEEERACLDLSFDRETYTRNFGVHAFCPEGEEQGFVTSNWFMPTLEMNGMSGGYTGSGFKTVIPSVARAKISCRLVPNQDPVTIAKAIAAYLRAKAPKGFKVTIEEGHGAPAYRVSPTSKVVKEATRALKSAFGVPAQCILCGASVPIVHDLAIASGAEAVLIGVGLDTDDIHAPNEHFSLKQLEQGFLTIATLLGDYAI